MNVAYGPVELKKFLEEVERMSQVDFRLVSCFPAFETCLYIYTSKMYTAKKMLA